jgi:hypothetical protein
VYPSTWRRMFVLILVLLMGAQTSLGAILSGFSYESLGLLIAVGIGMTAIYYYAGASMKKYEEKKGIV